LQTIKLTFKTLKMKTYRSYAIVFIALICSVAVSAQTADEIISKYVQAIGGKDLLTKITSVYTESTLDVMGMQGAVKTTTLNGKGMRQDMDISGSAMTTCYNDQGGWSINPMAGSTTPEAMAEGQYNSGKDQIVIGAPFINYTEKGYKAELVGNEAVGTINAVKIKLTPPDGNSSLYLFDPGTSYLIKSIQMMEMQGQMIDNETTYSDYRQVEGFTAPYKLDSNMAGGQFQMSMTVSKIELNKPVNDSIFSMPK
jgi:hypothetical protein